MNEHAIHVEDESRGSHASEALASAFARTLAGTPMGARFLRALDFGVQAIDVRSMIVF
jgi:hypothetical protein